ncbi:MAG TPA: trehalase family glycosidase [Candidatus Limnocylindrales bacterium]|nr:trehalase family glycosidase [Candidatus Limnocylindrales bacterium]
MDAEQTDLLEQAKDVLQMNDQGGYTVPAEGLYPHQWLWDSCFIAVGLRHTNIDRAKTEILSLLRGQWHNGMLPNMIFNAESQYRRDRELWRSWSSPYSPDTFATTGITQPPMLAEAIVKIGELLKKAERRSWYKQTYPALLAYHKWLYAERDPHAEGLVLQIHPWETGLDNTPPWMQELHDHQLAFWIRAAKKLNTGWIVNLFRRDTKRIPGAERLDPIEALAFYSIQRRLRRKSYDINKILSHSLFAIEDLTFNCILIRANQHLRSIAQLIKEDLSEELLERMDRTEAALEQVWDGYSGQYYSRNFVTHTLLKEPSIATLMPLYAGSITKDRADHLVRLLENADLFGTAYPVPSVPVKSAWFQPHVYWQGPTWINTNWLIIDGLKRMGFADHAAALTETTLEMLEKSGCYEYFSALDGTPAGAKNFSWTAALAIDLLNCR